MEIGVVGLFIGLDPVVNGPHCHQPGLVVAVQPAYHGALGDAQLTGDLRYVEIPALHLLSDCLCEKSLVHRGVKLRQTFLGVKRDV
jgi:hypothetical protein